MFTKNRWSLERRAAQARAFVGSETYILPILLDHTEVPGILPTISYLSWADGVSPIVDAVVKKLN